jgi:hypothetical protein
MVKFILPILAFWMAAACAEEPPAVMVLPNSDLCPAMCDHLADLKCPEAEAVYNNDLPGPVDVPNETCAIFCQEMQHKGVPMNPKCVLTVKSCDGIEPARKANPETCATK